MTEDATAVWAYPSSVAPGDYPAAEFAVVPAAAARVAAGLGPAVAAAAGAASASTLPATARGSWAAADPLLPVAAADPEQEWPDQESLARALPLDLQVFRPAARVEVD